MNLIFKKEDSEKYLSRWNEYLKNNVTSYKYLNINVEYFLLYAKFLQEDRSFVVVENNKCVGICFLPIEKIDEYYSISISGGYVFAPLSSETRVEKIIYQAIDSIAIELGIKKIKFSLDPLILEYKNKFNFLLDYKFVDTSTSDILVDLVQDEKDIWKGLRKSYKSIINNVLKDKRFELIIIKENNVDYEIHESYRDLHQKCSGIVTRNKKTFDKQFEMLSLGKATLIGLKYNDSFIGFNYFFHHNKTVIYASGADDPRFESTKIPIYHVILWTAFQYFHSKGFEYMQLSQPCGFSKVDGFENYHDDKQLNISYFKRGLGTKKVPCFRGIKYFDKRLFLEDIEIFKNKVCDIL